MGLSSSFYDYYAEYLFERFDCFNACVLDESADNHFRLLCDFAELQDGLKVLDAGCGSGQLLNYIFKNFKTLCTGIDLSLSQIKIAQANSLGPTYICQDFQQTPDQKYDRIFFMETVGYAGVDQYKVLEKYLSALTPNGYIIVSTFCSTKYSRLIGWEKIQSNYEQICDKHKFTLKDKIDLSSLIDYSRLDFNFIKNNFKYQIYDGPILNVSKRLLLNASRKFLTQSTPMEYIRCADKDFTDAFKLFKIHAR